MLRLCKRRFESWSIFFLAMAMLCHGGEPKGRVLTADVVALDQPTVYNRLGVAMPQAMIFALEGDVESSDAANPALTAGNVRLKSYKRPRPIVLRCNVGDTVVINFTNLLHPNTQPPNPIFPPQNYPNGRRVGTRDAGVHLSGLELSKDGGMNNDASFVGRNDLPAKMPPGMGSYAPPGGKKTYRYLAVEEGVFMLWSGAGDANGQMVTGLFGSTIVQPVGAEYYRSQVDRETMLTATLTQAYVKAHPKKYNLAEVKKNTTVQYQNDNKYFPGMKMKLWSLITYFDGPHENPFTTKTALVVIGENGRIYSSLSGHPIINYQAVYATGPRAGLPVLRMTQKVKGAKNTYKLVYSDLTAIITGPNAGRFPYTNLSPSFIENPATPDRRQPYREFSIAYHEAPGLVQAFPSFYNATAQVFLEAGDDAFAINYGSGGIGSEIIANRLHLGPMGNQDAVDLKFEEFFLSSWAVGDSAMVVDVPANAPNQTVEPITATINNDKLGPNGIPTATYPKNQNQPAASPKPRATKAYYPDDPSNVYHSYIRDHTKFRILHTGTGVAHVHHQHAHQWLHSPNSPDGHYLDSQLINPGSSYTLEMTYGGGGNRNQTVGDSIFHCHFYPHFARGMWSMWRVHDVFESGTQLDPDGVVAAGARALPDGEIARGTPIPGLVPLPTLGMAPLPAKVTLPAEFDGRYAKVQAEKDGGYRNPGYPFFIPGVAGHRSSHPPLDFGWVEDDKGQPVLKNGEKTLLDGGLPRHIMMTGKIVTENHSRWDFTKDFFAELPNGDHDPDRGGLMAFQLPEDGTAVEKAAMAFHAKRTHTTSLPDGDPGNFTTNGLPPVPGAPYAAPSVRNDGDSTENLRKYKAAVIQMDSVTNKSGWHYPQEKFLTLWDDVAPSVSGDRPPEPFFFRANTGETIEYWHTNTTPAYYSLDDFQVRTPIDIIGQHIHLVKFDVTSSDGAANGWNYFDGTLSPDEVRDRIFTINLLGGLYTFKDDNHFTKLISSYFECYNLNNGFQASYKDNLKQIKDFTSKKGGASNQEKLTAQDYKIYYPSFGDPPPGQDWNGTQTTIQRWDADPLLNWFGEDRTLRTVFTHDHFSPSTHQQAGLYAGLVVEPENSLWVTSSTTSGGKGDYYKMENGQPVAYTSADGQLLPGTIMGSRDDGGPTSWTAAILTTDVNQAFTPKRGFKNVNNSYREFLLEFQDSALAYQNASRTTTGAPFPRSGGCLIPNNSSYVTDLNMGTIGTGLADAINGASCYFKATANTKVYTLFETMVGSTPYEFNWIVTLADAVYVIGLEQNTMSSNLHIWQMSSLFNVNEDQKDSVRRQDISAFIKDLDNNKVSPLFNILFKVNGVTLNTLDEMGPPAKLTVTQLGASKQGPWLIHDALNRTTYPVVLSKLPRNKSNMLNVYTPQVRSWSDGAQALNPPADQFNEQVFSRPKNKTLKIGGPFPSLVSGGPTPGTYSINYRNEPIALRVWKPGKDSPLLSASANSNAQDLAYAFASIERWDKDYNTQPTLGSFINPAVNPADPPAFAFKFPKNPIVPQMGPTDPFTPLLRGNTGDKVQIRTLVGAHMVSHFFNLHGVDWSFEPSYLNSGYRSTQPMGISEHFEMLFDLPTAAAENNQADYLSTVSTDTRGLVNGNWVIMRGYDKGTGQDLYTLPNNPTDKPGKIDYNPPADAVVVKGSANVTKAGAHGKAVIREYTVHATTPGKVLKSGVNHLVYNSVSKKGAKKKQSVLGGVKKQNNDALNTLIYVNEEDLNRPGAGGKLQYCDTCAPAEGDSIQPLVLRANAGEWIRVTLINDLTKSDLPPTTSAFEAAKDKGGSSVPFNVKSSGKPKKTSGLPFSGETSTPLDYSLHVGLHADMVDYDITVNDAYNVGDNPVQTVAPGNQRTYTWYAGDLVLDHKGNTVAKPNEYGGINLSASDPLLAHKVGLFGALVIEPAGSYWDYDPDLRKGHQDPTQVNVYPPHGHKFREFVAIVNDDANLVLWEDGKNNLTKAGAVKIANTTYAVNYGTERQGDRWTGDLVSMSDYTQAKSNAQMFTKTQRATLADQTPKLIADTDPKTPIFVAEVYSSVRFRWLHPTTLSGGNGESITLHGHVWQEEPYKKKGTKIGFNPLSQWFGTRDKFGGLDRWELVLPSAGGKDGVTGDYLYTSIPVEQAKDGVWGLFRVVPKMGGMSSIRGAVLQDGQVVAMGLSAYDPAKASFQTSVILEATSTGGEKIQLGTATADTHTGVWSFTGPANNLSLGATITAQAADGTSVSTVLTRPKTKVAADVEVMPTEAGASTDATRSLPDPR